MAASLPIALPQPVAEMAAHRWRAFIDVANRKDSAWHPPAGWAAEAERVFAFSDFVFGACTAQPALLMALVDSGDLFRPFPEETFPDRLAAYWDPQAGEDAADAWAAALRRFRRREMVRIAWRDLAGRADLNETMAELSALAEACIRQALARLYADECAALGRPENARGDAPGLVVVALGKLGARELNFSSDVDLVFAFPSHGRTTAGPRSVRHEEFFTRLARHLIQVLSTSTGDGFVFRVDARLRPYGEGGPLAMGFDAMEDYYQRQGREWERYAWIKARVVAGDPAAGEQLLARLRPFVFRRYLDFGAFASLREMKANIEAEVRRKGLAGNIKLGRGGIREIEFFGQMFQLIRGGVVPALQDRRILAILDTLAQEGAITADVCRDLTEAYVFLRRTENRLQEVADRQTHDLPTENTARLRLAAAMGETSWAHFAQRLQRHTDAVHRHFKGLLTGAKVEDDARDRQRRALAELWKSLTLDHGARQALAEAGFDAPEAVRPLLEHLNNDPTTRALSPEGRQRLDRLLPMLVQAAGRTDQPLPVLNRIVDLLLSIERRTNYLALLLENPNAVRHLVRLVAASPWVSSFLARHPVLLDELLDPRTLYRPESKAAVAREADRRLAAVVDGDLEYQVEQLCILRQTHTLRVAAADVTGALPIMRTSDYLTELAEVILEKVLGLAWAHLAARHGPPGGMDIADPGVPSGFAVIAYGKAGGLELGYGSDLDLVFVHAGSRSQSTHGPRPISNAQFFARIGERIVHILTAHTRAGRIYEVDMRLRPSGSAGPLVIEIEAFRDYQLQDAWTWEHQAIVRARPVAGDASLGERFKAIRAEVLRTHRDGERLREEVRQMRERMRAEHLAAAPGIFDLRRDPGGIVDIEFLVQYLVLLESHRHPSLVDWTDNVRLLQTLIRTGILDEERAFMLREAYLIFRAKAHQLSLREQPAAVTEARFAALRDRVRRVWREIMETDQSR
jgi:[glutamine synthetase] adenylyltransferase / [glutamine synthetase]-adenylyl-L-tyrosine phosphorylase